MILKRNLVCFGEVLLCSLGLVAILPSRARADSVPAQASCSLGSQGLPLGNPGGCANFTAWSGSLESRTLLGTQASGTWISTPGGATPDALTPPTTLPIYSGTFATAAPITFDVSYYVNLDATLLNSFNSIYGPGGTLQISGPDGFAFSGTFLDGTFVLQGGSASPGTLLFQEYLNMDFIGTTSDGTPWSGTLALSDGMADVESEFTLSSTPEPPSMLLVGIGLSFVWFWERKRSSSNHFARSPQE